MSPEKQAPNDTYHRLMQALKGIWEDAENRTVPPLKEGLELSKQKLSELEELTKEELDTVAGFLQRDLQDAADFLQQSGKAIGDWVRTDLAFAEYKFSELFADLAETTRSKLDEIAEQARAVGEWHTGEITGVGILECKNCGEKIHFKTAGHIPPCPKCQATVYRKLFSEDE
jgi:uncharacterized protein YgfB (UPF0149 family)